MRFPLVQAVTGLLLVAAAGCKSPQVTLGTGLLAFLPVADSQPLPIIKGIQGGFHVWASLLARDLTPDGSHACLSLNLVDTGELVSLSSEGCPPTSMTCPQKAGAWCGPANFQAADASEIAPVYGRSAGPDNPPGTCDGGGAANAGDGGSGDGGMAPAPDLAMRARDDGGVPFTLSSAASDWSMSLGLTARMFADPCTLAGRKVRLRVDLTDGSGHTASDQRIIVPSWQ